MHLIHRSHLGLGFFYIPPVYLELKVTNYIYGEIVWLYVFYLSVHHSITASLSIITKYWLS